MDVLSVVKFILVVFFSYLAGGLSFGWMVARFKGVNILQEGSGNPGFTNVWRTLGLKSAALVLLGDALKGFVSVWFGHMMAGTVGMMTAFVVVIFGHSFSYMLHFKGGKGIATAAGALFYISPFTLVLCFLVLVVIVAATRYMSLGSVTVAVLCPLFLFLDHQPNLVISVVVLMAIYVIWLHRENIKRLINGTENKVGMKRR